MKKSGMFTVMFTFHLFGQVNSVWVSYEVGLNTIRLVN